MKPRIAPHLGAFRLPNDHTAPVQLKDDARLVKGDVAVLVTAVLPKGVEDFAFVNGIWVTAPIHALSVATALRMQLIEVATTKLAAIGKNEKMEVLYHYLSGSEFRQRVEAIVEAFVEGIIGPSLQPIPALTAGEEADAPEEAPVALGAAARPGNGADDRVDG